MYRTVDVRDGSDSLNHIENTIAVHSNMWVATLVCMKLSKIFTEPSVSEDGGQEGCAKCLSLDLTSMGQHKNN